ncbi:MAG: hypothetical protein HETSPECPRED_006475 [Heterodermia speciosa]|uniref:Chromosome transmission fidelity protein 8 n=1 Tax=Heterodermia speciosa TaxID=116794 RepID=A0A8H3FJA6_9LECA|nr:MAG: hypothetical protein HETSPECPRED_006475 [Heterodermia speciosa]
MPTVPIHPRPSESVEARSHVENPLPQFLQTPAGLAILELQGTIHIPDSSEEPDIGESIETVPIGRLVFPDYRKDDPSESQAWMKKVYLYVGRHQRLTGEVKKLANPMAVLRRIQPAATGDELEIADIIYYKILFSSRPEPVSG